MKMKKSTVFAAGMLLCIVLAFLAVPAIVHAQTSDTASGSPVFSQPTNWIAVAISIVVPLASALLVRYRNVMSQKLTSFIGAAVLVAQGVYGVINVEDLSKVDIGLLLSAAVTAFILFISKDPEKSE